jgi:hypothetical protein
MLFNYGSISEPFMIPGAGVPVVSGQTVTYYVSVPPGSPIGGSSPVFICAIFGWYWPRVQGNRKDA